RPSRLHPVSWSLLTLPRPPRATLFPYTTLFRSHLALLLERQGGDRSRLPLYGIPFAVKDNIDAAGFPTTAACPAYSYDPPADARSEEHTSELQSRENLVCRLLLEKKKTKDVML